MTDQSAARPSEPLALDRRSRHLAREVAAASGVEVNRCFLCQTCSNGCPFYQAMDLGPHRLMRLLHFGQRREILESSTIWLCVGCHTCSAACPMSLDIAAVMDALRHLALKEGAEPAEPAILAFHRQVLRSIQRHGRTHKLEIMLRFKAGQGKWLEDMDLGLKMLAKRKLDLRPSKIKSPHDLDRLFSKSWEA